jgi:ribonuclease P/MRP protein subunit POP5
LSFATSLPKPVSQPCVFQVVRVSGTIRKAEEEAIRRARITIRRAQRPKEQATVTAASMAGAASALVEDDDLGMANGIEDLEEPGDGEEDSEMGRDDS